MEQFFAARCVEVSWIAALSLMTLGVSAQCQASDLAQYKAMYPNSPLCSKDELTLWTCETPKKHYAVCSSPSMTKTSGYMQYRVSLAGKLVFVYPENKTHPHGKFQFFSAPNGNAGLSFKNEKFEYSLFDPLSSNSSISVEAIDTNKTVAEVACKNGNQSLQINYTLDMFHDAGIEE